LWKLLITKAFIKQFLKLEKGSRDFVLDSLDFLLNTLNLDIELELDIIDEYSDGVNQSKPFPLTYNIDYDKELIYLICIEEHLLKPKEK